MLPNFPKCQNVGPPFDSCSTSSSLQFYFINLSNKVGERGGFVLPGGKDPRVALSLLPMTLDPPFITALIFLAIKDIWKWESSTNRKLVIFTNFRSTNWNGMLTGIKESMVPIASVNWSHIAIDTNLINEVTSTHLSICRLAHQHHHTLMCPRWYISVGPPLLYQPLILSNFLHRRRGYTLDRRGQFKHQRRYHIIDVYLEFEMFVQIVHRPTSGLS